MQSALTELMCIKIVAIYALFYQHMLRVHQSSGPIITLLVQWVVAASVSWHCWLTGGAAVASYIFEFKNILLASDIVSFPGASSVNMSSKVLSTNVHTVFACLKPRAPCA